MRRQDQDKSDEQGTPLAVWGPALIAMGVMLTGFVGTLMVLELDAFRPKVGDMVVFQPNSQDTDVWQLEVPATEVAGRNGAGTCMLNPTVMATNGGSLVVEARRETSPPVYRLHWAGKQTESGANDCGPTADFSVTRTDLQKLANAAGGFGVGNKGIVR
ncbi:MAG: hypothetical protein P4L71_03815 [Acetobacteraceae bacterium]|nr:hypothetical protein [Acetobacteraceae bacterium]